MPYDLWIALFYIFFGVSCDTVGFYRNKSIGFIINLINLLRTRVNTYIIL